LENSGTLAQEDQLHWCRIYSKYWIYSL